MQRPVFILAGAILQPLASAMALLLFDAPPVAVWSTYFVVLAVTLGLLARPMLACLRSVTTGAEAQTAEDRLRKAKAERKLKAMTKTRRG